jgi:formate-dependent nitrite reductase membrane component NrfD
MRPHCGGLGHGVAVRRLETTLLLVNGAAGLLVAGYTGPLLAATAVPLWSKRPALLGPLFLSSAMASGAAAIAGAANLMGRVEPPEEAALRRLEAIAALAEGTLLVAWIETLGPTGRMLTEGRLGAVVRYGVLGAGLALPLAISAFGGRLPRPWRRAGALLASALTLAGGFALRYAVVEGGRQSADDPEATFAMAR